MTDNNNSLTASFSIEMQTPASTDMDTEPSLLPATATAAAAITTTNVSPLFNANHTDELARAQLLIASLKDRIRQQASHAFSFACPPANRIDSLSLSL